MNVDAAVDDTGEEVDAAAAAGIDNTGVSSTSSRWHYFGCVAVPSCCVDAAGDDTGEEVDAAAAAGIDNTGVGSMR
jgi:hypothetical protein